MTRCQLLKGRILPPKLEFGNTELSDDPLKAFANPRKRCKPYRYIGSNEVDIIPILPENNSECGHIIKILNDLVSGVMNPQYWRAKYPGFESIFGTRINILEIEYYKDPMHGASLIESLARRNKANLTLAVVGLVERTPPCGAYQSMKIRAIVNDIPTQFITGLRANEYHNHTAEDRGNFIWNIAMGIFSKLGGIPWRLPEAMRGVSAILGMNTISRWESGVMDRIGVSSIEVVNSWGEPYGRFFSDQISVQKKGKVVRLDSKDIYKLVSQALLSIQEYLPQAGTDDIIVFHLSDFYSKEVYGAIEQALEDRNCINYKILHITEHSDYRSFDSHISDDNKAWPKAGTFLFREPKRQATFYAAGSWNYYRPDSYYVMNSGQKIPIDVGFVRGSEKPNLEIRDLEHIFQLTRLNYNSADIPSIRMPITIRLGSDAASLALCGLPTSSFHISHLY